MKRNIRRKFIKSLFLLPLATAFSAKAASRTPSATEGPFYPLEEMRFDDVDNNLVKIAGKVEQAGGELIILRGRVIDTQGNPIKGARVEIWQCDVNGHYLHFADRNPVPRDTAFQGFGQDISNDKGEYSFRTIKPVSYPGRTPHIHVKAFANGRELTTQFYLHGHPQNNRDFLFQRMSKVQQDAVSMNLQKGPDGLETQVNIVV